MPAHFPYPSLKPGQADLISMLTDALENGLTVLVEAYNGVGKTVSAVYSLARLGEPGVFAVRTYEEVKNYLKEAKAVGIKIAPLLSKRSFCGNPAISRLPEARFYEECTKIVKRGECPFAREAKRVLPEKAPLEDLNLLLSWLRREGACPFAFSVRAALSAQAVVLTYPYLVRPGVSDAIYGLLGEKTGNLIVDECHNLLDVFLGAVTVLTPLELREVSLAFKGELRYAVRSLSKRLARGEVIPEELLDLVAWPLAEWLGIERLTGYKAGRGTLYLYGDPKLPRGERATVYMGGFIPPTIAELLGVKKVERVEAPEELKVRVYVATGLTSRFGEREKHAKEFKRFIEEFSRLPGRKAVFYTSEELMQLIGVPENAVRPKRVFKPPNTGNYLVADVIGGRLSEGANLPLDAVLVVGFPFPEPDERLRFLMEGLSRLRGREFAWRFYEDLALCRLVQAVGRLTRNPGSWAVILDERALKYTSRYPSWMQVEEWNGEWLVKNLRDN